MVNKVKTTILHIYTLLQLGQVFLFMSLRIQTFTPVYYSHTETVNQNHRKNKKKMEKKKKKTEYSSSLYTHHHKKNKNKNLGNTEGLHGKAYHLTRNAISHSYHKLWESQKRLCCTVSSIMSIRFQIKTQIISSTASLLFLLLSIHIHSLVSGN